MVLKRGCKHLTAQQRDWMLFSQEKDLKIVSSTIHVI